MDTHSAALPIPRRPLERPTRRRRRILLAPLVLLALLLTGCAGTSGASEGASATGDSAGGTAQGATSAPALATTGARAAVERRAVVSTGTITLTSADPAEVRTGVDRLLTAYDGILADEQTSTDRHGRPQRSTLRLRVPAEDFGTMMRRLAGLGTLRGSSRQAEDVTTRVIDVEQQIAAQRVGLRRLEQLMSRAGSLSALLAVEKQVTERRGSLDSLQQQRAYLADQTSLATITLRVDRATHPAVVARAHGGFLGGLADGWAALLSVLGGLLRGAGAVLPFAVVALVLWLPARAVVRRVRRAQGPSGPAQPAGS